MNSVIAAYNNGGYSVAIHEDGTKIRTEFDASIAPVFPEQMDLKITNWCDAGCHWCHEHSTRRGRHGDVDGMLKLLSDLPAGVEIAIGGGDPLSHPEFERLVRGLRGHGLIPSVTVNGRHLERHLPLLKRLTADKQVFGVGVSFFEKLPEWDYENLVVHMIAGVDDPAVLDNVSSRKLLILGYKNFGRGVKFRSKQSEKVQANIDQWYRELIWMVREHRISFDTLAISMLKPNRLFKSQHVYKQRFMGEEGQFSMYVDGVQQEYAVSSYSSERNGWADIKTMFEQVRSKAF